MPNPRGPKPEPGPHQKTLAGMQHSDERSAYKSGVLAGLVTGSRTFTKNGIRFTISNVKVDGIMLTMKVAASDARGTLPVDRDGYLFVNPPILAHNGTWREEPGTLPGGEAGLVEVRNIEENPLSALQQIVHDAVVTYAMNRGWSPSQP